LDDFRFINATRFTASVAEGLPRRSDTCCRVEAPLVLGKPSGAVVSTVARWVDATRPCGICGDHEVAGAASTKAAHTCERLLETIFVKSFEIKRFPSARVERRAMVRSTQRSNVTHPERRKTTK
jgi:hypothetical protein